MILLCQLEKKISLDCLRKWFVFLVCLSGGIFLSARGQVIQKPVDLTELSLEDLMNVEVTLVSKKPEKMTEAAAAVYVLTQDDICRSGATNIPDLLRLIPGVQVARIDENKWAISARGFNDIFANKLLVLIDGRSTYSPIFSGVLWEAQDVLLRDIDRIEVVRGPGATLWGANAVNGIINIITRKAQDTQGGSVCLGIGSEEKGFGGFRYGGRIGQNVYYRFYTKYFKRNHSVFENSTEAADQWNATRGGFRVDYSPNQYQSLTVQGDLYGGTIGQAVMVPILNIHGVSYNSRYSGGNVLGRWTRTLSSTSEMVLRLYADRVTRRDSNLIGGSYTTYDADFQHRFRLDHRQNLIWGLGYRLTRDQVDESGLLICVPPRRTYDVVNAFFEDEVSFFHDHFRLILGSKFEHNDFTGFEYQPGFRFLWRPISRHSIWGAVSRAIRTPARVDHDMQSLLVRGNSRFRSEVLDAFELGYHLQSSNRFYIDLAAFNNLYNRLRSLEPVDYGNKKSAQSFGFETSADWSVSDRWRFRGTYSHLQIRMNLEKDSKDPWGKGPEEESPRHQFTIRSSVKLSGNTDLDLSGRYVHRLPSPNLRVPSYFELDVCLDWRPIKKFDISIVGRNLIHRFHPEFTADWVLFAATQVQRSIYGAITWSF